MLLITSQVITIHYKSSNDLAQDKCRSFSGVVSITGMRIGIIASTMVTDDIPISTERHHFRGVDIGDSLVVVWIAKYDLLEQEGQHC